MLKICEGFGLPRKNPMRRAAAILFSAMLGASPAFAAHGGSGFHGGFHGSGFHGSGFHGSGGFHGGSFNEHGFHGGHVYAGGFHGRWRHGGWGGRFYPGLGFGLALGLGSPWGWDYYPAYGGYYGTATPYYSYYGNAAPYYGYYGTTALYPPTQNWYYCANPSGYYPYVTQCYSGWQTVPAS